MLPYRTLPSFPLSNPFSQSHTRLVLVVLRVPDGAVVAPSQTLLRLPIPPLSLSDMPGAESPDEGVVHRSQLRPSSPLPHLTRLAIQTA